MLEVVLPNCLAPESGGNATDFCDKMKRRLSHIYLVYSVAEAESVRCPQRILQLVTANLQMCRHDRTAFASACNIGML